MNYYNQIKEQLINNEIYKKVKDYSKNRSDLKTYYNVGKLLIEAQGGEERARYGDNLIKEYSEKLTKEIGKKFTPTLLRNIRQFYLIFQKYPTVSDKLSWSHYVEILSINNKNEINYYVNISIKLNLSVRELRYKIKNKEYERLDNDTKEKLFTIEENKVSDLIKNPILIKNSYNYTKITEKVLKQLILEDMDNFLTELGEGFCYIKNEYKIKLGDRYNYIDLLLYNIKYNCYVAVELKVTELKKEHIGQIKMYMNYIDKNIKNIHQDRTIGIIIVKKDNEFIMEYCSDERIFETSFILN
ncbi:MAG: DUF1016 domain-containing protein [Firmicutes bacterium]|nr:DUF1016 domain-containing protein [Bacillota bacterium]